MSVARMEDNKNIFRITVGKSKAKMPLRRLRSWCENDSMMDFKEMQWDEVNWIHLTQDGKKWRAV